MIQVLAQSTNGGINWSTTNKRIQHSELFDVSFTYTDNGTSVRELVFYSTPSIILRTTDGGIIGMNL